MTDNTKIKVTEYIAQFLEDRGVNCVFEMAGGMITHLLDSIQKHPKIKIVSMHHEQGAAFAAEAFGRMMGIPGVALATSGPGATNLLTGIGSCYFDSTPTVFITGQVNRIELKGDRAIRQLGFQETDIVSIVKPITKAAWQITEPEQIPESLVKAFELASSGRPGPVLIDIPMDVQRAEIAPYFPGKPKSSLAFTENSQASSFLKNLSEKLSMAQRPLILVGGGIRSSGTVENFLAFIDKFRIPVVTSLMGLDVLDYNHPLRVGLIGTYGNRWANAALMKSDCLIVLGSRLDVRQTGSNTSQFRGNRPIFHVDCEPGEINNRIKDCFELVADLKTFFSVVMNDMDQKKYLAKEEWLEEILKSKLASPDIQELTDVLGINPNVFMHKLSSSARNASAYVVDVGQHQMWAAQSIEIQSGQRFVTSGGMGSMGFALPAAVGVAMSMRNKPVILIAGDGGFQTNIQELQTVFRNQLPIKMVVINNQCHGMVRQFQQSYFNGNYQSTLVGYSAPDFSKIALAYGVQSLTIQQESQMDSGIQWLCENPNQPALLQVMIDTMANAYPKVAFGKPINHMEP